MNKLKKNITIYVLLGVQLHFCGDLIQRMNGKICAFGIFLVYNWYKHLELLLYGDLCLRAHFFLLDIFNSEFYSTLWTTLVLSLWSIGKILSMINIFDLRLNKGYFLREPYHLSILWTKYSLYNCGSKALVIPMSVNQIFHLANLVGSVGIAPCSCYTWILKGIAGGKKKAHDASYF